MRSAGHPFAGGLVALAFVSAAGCGAGTTASSCGNAPSGSPITVKHFEPTAIRVTVDDLPKPFATDSARKSPDVVSMPLSPSLEVPAGFAVNVFASELDKPRWLQLTPEGDVLVTETRENRIRRLRDTTGNGRADENVVFATADNGLDIPFGMAFSQGWFFLGNSHEVRRYAYEAGKTLAGTGDRITELPGGGYNQHWTRNVITSADGHSLFVSIGSATNVDVEPPPRAAVLQMGLDGSRRRVFASGLRNPVGLAIEPKTGALYTTVNERDLLGDDLVPDYFTRVQDGAFYGWPYAYLRADKIDPRRKDEPDVQSWADKTVTPDVLFQAHSASLGVAFYDKQLFPERYRGGAFVAFRGSWNRDSGTGYKIVFVPFEDGRPVGHYEDFLRGFLLDPAGPTTWGRPVGLLVLPDGSLLFTEEANGRIFRVSYKGT